jgi:hypothetical protein
MHIALRVFDNFALDLKSAFFQRKLEKHNFKVLLLPSGGI